MGDDTRWIYLFIVVDMCVYDMQKCIYESLLNSNLKFCFTTSVPVTCKGYVIREITFVGEGGRLPLYREIETAGKAASNNKISKLLYSHSFTLSLVSTIPALSL